MPRAEKNGTNGSATKGGTTAGIVKLSDLAIEGREFELFGKNYKTKSPITLTLPEIAKIDKMGKEVNKWLPSFGEGKYEEVDLDAFQQLLYDLVVAISNVPEEVAKKAVWWQQLLIVGLFQSVAGMDFLGEQLPKLAGVPEAQRKKIQEALRNPAKTQEKTSSTSPTP
jgi:hypothetical protein